MAVQRIKIVPNFPSGLAKSVTGAGGRMLGQKMAIEQAGRMATASMNNRAAWNRQTRSINARADLANNKMNIKLGMGGGAATAGVGKDITNAAIKILNNKNSIISRENVKRLDYGQEAQPLLRLADVLREDFGIVVDGEMSGGESALAPASQATTPAPNASTAAFRNLAISLIPQANRGLKIRGYAEGGVVDQPEMAMVGEQGKEFIVPENKITPEMAAQLEQVVGGQNGQQVPTREGLAQLMSQIPNPEKIVSDKLPKVEQLMEQLGNYENVQDAHDDLVQLDQDLMDVGMDLADVKGIEQFVQAYAEKFGQEAAQKLVEDAVSRRGQ